MCEKYKCKNFLTQIMNEAICKIFPNNIFTSYNLLKVTAKIKWDLKKELTTYSKYRKIGKINLNILMNQPDVFIINLTACY